MNIQSRMPSLPSLLLGGALAYFVFSVGRELFMLSRFEGALSETVVLYALLSVGVLYAIYYYRLFDALTIFIRFLSLVPFVFVYMTRNDTNALQEFMVLRNFYIQVFVVLFVLVGIGIMLRTKLPQTFQDSLQKFLPVLITSLILILFSYALVHLVVDIVRI